MALPPEDPPAGVPDWVLTYGDMMSLLLCFFILLAAMSEIKTNDQNKMIIQSIVEQFGDEQQVAMLHASTALNRHTRQVGSTVDTVKQKVTTNRKKAASGAIGPPGRRTRIQTIREGNRQTIGAPILFEPGKAVLLDDAKEAMKSAADALRGKRHMIEIRGFEPTGPIPAGSPFKSNFELAFARTKAVADFLVNEAGIRRQILRVCVAAPVEVAALPTSPTGEPMQEVVTIATAESSIRDFERDATESMGLK